MSDLSQYSLDTLRKHQLQVFRQASNTRPEVSLIEIDGRQAVLKDFNQGHRWFGLLLGPLLIWREARALKRLQGLPGIPQILSQPNKRAVLMEYVAGETAKTMPKGQLGPDFFQRVRERIAGMHERGIAHCDLRSGGNTIIDSEGNPHFVDFVGHWQRGAFWNLPWRWVFSKFCIADQIAIIRLKQRLAPELITPEDRIQLDLDRNHPLARGARFVGHGIKKILQAILGKKA